MPILLDLKSRLSSLSERVKAWIHPGKSPSARTSPMDVKLMRIDMIHNRVYRNGLQQAEILLYVEGYTELSESEIDSIRIFNYDDRIDDECIPFSEDGDGVASYHGWTAQRERRVEYESIPHTHRASVEAIGIYKRLFVSVNEDQTMDWIRLAFAITGDAGWIYRSTGWVRAAPTEAIPNPQDKYESGADSGDKYDTHVQSLAPVTYSGDDFRLDRHGIGGYVFNDVVTLSIRDDIYSTRIVHMCCEPVGMIHWRSEAAGARNPCFVGYVEPGEVLIHWHPEIPTGSEERPEVLPQPEPGKGAFMLCGRQDIPRPVDTSLPMGPVVVEMTDSYGSKQFCHIAFSEDTRDQLEIL